MNASLSDDQVELGIVARSFLATYASETELHRLADDPHGWDRRLWDLAADQLGVHALAIPEAYGGAGYGLVELGIVFEELGRALVGAPFLASVGLAASLLLAFGDEEACKEYLPGIACGELICTVAVSELSTDWSPTDICTRAEDDGHGWRLSGQKRYVLDGLSAHLLLVAAQTDDGVAVFAVESDADGLAREAMQTLDPTRRLAAVTFDGTRGRMIGSIDAAWPAIERAQAVGCALLAAEQVGGIGRVLDMAVQYAKDRVQFGRPIGSFQAIKHKCADMLVEYEASRSAAFAALNAVETGDTNHDIAVSVARAYCSEAYSHCAGENLHIHGGIGFTWEHPAHLYLKRARSSEILLGESRQHFARIASLVWADL